MALLPIGPSSGFSLAAYGSVAQVKASVTQQLLDAAGLLSAELSSAYDAIIDFGFAMTVAGVEQIKAETVGALVDVAA
jgi:hypothetical protein